MSLRKVFDSGKKAFVAYLTAGDPNPAATVKFLHALQRGGADIIELGVPHSDPVADGPTNLLAANRALQSGTSLEGVLKIAATAKAEGVTAPLVLFTYYNPILQMGLERFAASCCGARVDGVLVVDLPPEEADDYLGVMNNKGVPTIFLASPTTAPERLPAIAEASTGFVYYVSRTGVTGEQKAVSETLGAEVAKLREVVKRPVCIGFGISTAAQVREVAAFGDGVVVGSALVKEIETSASVEEAERKLAAKCAELVAGLKGD